MHEKFEWVWGHQMGTSGIPPSPFDKIAAGDTELGGSISLARLAQTGGVDKEIGI